MMQILISSGRMRLRNGKLSLRTAPSSNGGSGGGGAATALAVAEIVPLDRTLLQRDVGVTTVTKTVTGTYAGSPSALQWRLYNKTTSTAWTSWATLPVSFSGGAFSADIALPSTLEPLTFQIRDGVDNSITAECTKRFGVGEHVLCIGQSNMAFLAQSTYQYPTGGKSSYTFMASAWHRLGNINDALPPNLLNGQAGYPGANSESGSSRADGIVYFANYLSAALGCMVAISDYAVPGSAISSWQPNATNNNMDKALQAMTASGGGGFGTVLWLQGEDGELANYQSQLQNVMTGCQAFTGRGNSLNFGPIFTGPSNGYNADANWMSTIRQSILGFLAANSGVAGVFCGGSAVDCNLAGTSNIHFDAISQARQGKRYAKAVGGKLLGVANAGAGPKIVSASRSGLSVVVTFQHALGTALVDGAGGNGASLQGFRFFDAGAGGAQIGYTASSITSATTVTFTLASLPTGVLSMDFGMANAPFGGATAPATVLYDNDVVPGDTLGLPLQPKAAFAVS
jgi:hypothetical protein